MIFGNNFPKPVGDTINIGPNPLGHMYNISYFNWASNIPGDRSSIRCPIRYSLIWINVLFNLLSMECLLEKFRNKVNPCGSPSKNDFINVIRT